VEIKSFLIVDDEPSCRETFHVALEDEYRLIDAEIGEKALEILQSREDIDLVLLDYYLPPGIDGLEVLERMRKLKCEVPVVIVTGKGSEEVCRKAFKMGVQDYIQKPFKVGELHKAIRGTIVSTSGEKKLVDQAVEFMEEQYCRPISSIDVAQGVGISYAHLARSFKVNKGCTVENWLNTLRIDKAKSLLKSSNLEIKEVAAKVGVNDQNYFYQLFKKATGKSPSEYRDDLR
jgi:YesN/AraC family two-component response regulator